MLDAAKAMKLSAKDLLELNVIDEIIQEPIGGAHRDKDKTLENVKNSIIHNLKTYEQMTSEEIINEKKFLKIGRDKGFIDSTDELSSLDYKKASFQSILKSKKLIISSTVLVILLISLLIII